MAYEPEFEETYERLALIGVAVLKDDFHKIWLAGKNTNKTKQELERGEWFIDITCGVGTTINIDKDYSSLGRERKTYVQSILAAEQILKRDRLAAWVDQHCGAYEPKDDEKAFFLFLRKGEYRIGCETPDGRLCQIYMPEETAKWLREKLNSGEIVL